MTSEEGTDVLLKVYESLFLQESNLVKLLENIREALLNETG